jgi:hypothetical protein
LSKVLATIQVEIEVPDNEDKYGINSLIASEMCDVVDSHDNILNVHYNHGDYQVEA